MSALPWTDHVTVLRAQPGIRLAKAIAPDDSCSDYDNAKHYSAKSVPVSGLLDLADLLRRMQTLPDRCVVRGEPLADTNRNYMQRRTRPDAESGEPATLAEHPRRWLLIDADGISRPEHISAHDLLACADLALELLPAPFQRAACIVTASANHGIKPGCRLRLAFWCDRPMLGRELNRWLRGAPIDTSVFRPAQCIYTAAPIFTGGRRDHLPSRMVEYPGEDWLQCPSAEELAEPPPAPVTPPEKIARGKQASAYADAALADAADAIIEAVEGRRHETIVMQSRSLGRLVQAGMIAASDVASVLSQAAVRSGKTDAEEVASCIAWGLANPSGAKLPEAKHAA